jgi:glycosyltransferase involved in cell wall biosynthesis
MTVRQLIPIESQGNGPLRVMFVATSMTTGGEEILLVEILRRMDRARFAPELCCLKYLGGLGESMAREVPAVAGLLSHKWDLRVLPRLARVLRQRQIDAVVTVGTGGDKMFWGRLAAWFAGVPVIVSAIHSMGWPLRVEWLNRRLAPITDAFIAAAPAHAGHLVAHEGCPAEKVHVICNGVDSHRFRPQPPCAQLRAQLRLPQEAPVVGIVAEIRREKNHSLWLRVAADVHRAVPTAHFLIIGDGAERKSLESQAASLGIAEAVHFCGRRKDVPDLLSLMDVFLLTSKMEANPVSILEALSCGKPVVSTNVGSIPEKVVDGVTGYLAGPSDQEGLAQGVLAILANPRLAAAMGRAGREAVVRHYSVEQMVAGYENLIQELYTAKRGGKRKTRIDPDSSVTQWQTAELADLQPGASR